MRLFVGKSFIVQFRRMGKLGPSPVWDFMFSTSCEVMITWHVGLICRNCTSVHPVHWLGVGMIIMVFN